MNDLFKTIWMVSWILLSLAGCGDKTESTENSTDPDTQNTDDSSTTQDNQIDTSNWQRHLIGEQDSPIYVYSADLDNDGDLDLVVTSSDHMGGYLSEIAWYQNNDGGTSWDKHIIEDASNSEPVVAANGVVVADLDNDGNLDIAVSSGPMGNGPGAAVIYYNAGDPTSQWLREVLYQADDETLYKVYAHDFDDDDDLDLIVGGGKTGHIFLNPGARQQQWTRHPMNELTGGCVYLADINTDGKLDVISANTTGGVVSWSDVTVDGDEVTFVDETISNQIAMALDTNIIELQGDNTPEILVSRIGGPGLRWFASDGQTWTENMVDEDYSVTDIYTGDIDKNGTTDIVAAGISMMSQASDPPNIAWFEYTKDDAGDFTWQKHWIEYDEPDQTFPGDLELQDVDGDGDLDVVTTALKDHKVYWYENLLAL